MAENSIEKVLEVSRGGDWIILIRVVVRGHVNKSNGERIMLIKVMVRLL